MQDFYFTYKLPENPQPFLKEIKAGKQTFITGTELELNKIIEQHKHYGFMEVSGVKKGFGGLCYRFNKSISVENIKAGFTQKESEMIEKAQEARSVTTAVQDEMIRKVTQEYGGNQANVIDFEVKEEKKNIGDNAKKFKQTIEVVNQEIDSAPKTRRRK